VPEPKLKAACAQLVDESIITGKIVPVLFTKYIFKPRTSVCRKLERNGFEVYIIYNKKH